MTAFTASEFGRTLASTGDGADHGWGSHHFVVGGAVNGEEDAGQGRLPSTTSVDQFASTLATWFGVSNTELDLVVPNIKN